MKEMNQEISEIIFQIKNLIDALSKTSKLDQLTKEIEKIEELKHLFIDDEDKEYECSNLTKSKKFSHLQKCVILTSKYNILEEYIDLYLIDHPETINYQNEKRWTALMIASRNSNFTSTEKTVEILLKHGADVNLKGNTCQTALMLSAGNSGMDSTERTVELLLKNNADLNIQNIYGRTALIFSMSNQRKSTVRTVELLLEHGSNINLRDKSNFLAITYAIANFNKNERIVELFLQKMDNCDIHVGIAKLIKFLYIKGMPVRIIELAIQKGAKIEDIGDKRIIEFIQFYRGN